MVALTYSTTQINSLQRFLIFFVVTIIFLLTNLGFDLSFKVTRAVILFANSKHIDCKELVLHNIYSLKMYRGLKNELFGEIKVERN